MKAPSAMSKIFSEFMVQNGHIDPWRHFNPTVRKYSFYSYVHLLRKEQRKRSDPSAGFYSKEWSETSMGQTLANRYVYGKTKSNPRASVG